MKKVSMRLIILIIAFLSLTLLEILLSEETVESEMVMVYVTKEKIPSGTQIESDMIESVGIPKHLASEYLIKEDIEGYTITDLQAGQFIYGHQLTDKPPILIEENERMITIQCSTVEANGWLFEINELVDLVMIHREGKIVIEDARVCRLFSDTQSTSNDYLSLIVNENASYLYYENVSKSQVYIGKKQ